MSHAAKKMRNAPLSVNCMRVGGKWPQSLPGFNKLVQYWAELAFGKTGGEVSIVLADNDFIQNLNHMYRGKNKPTNVLAFTGSDGELGDVILAYETIRDEAKAQKKTFRSHAAHLVIHGCLHLAGYEHENQQEAKIMEAHETAILRQLGVSDPYSIVV